METAAESPYGPPAFPAALLSGISARTRARMGTNRAESHYLQVLAAAEGHFSGVAAMALAAKDAKRKRPPKPGAPPPAPPKVPISVFCGSSPRFAEATRDALREFGAKCGVVFAPEFVGIGAAPDGYEDSWYAGVDGTLDTSPGNLRSWANRIKSVHLLFTTTAKLALIEHFLRSGGAAVIEIVDSAAVFDGLRRFSHYKIVNIDGTLYAICTGCRVPGHVGTGVYDALVDALVDAVV